MKASDNFTGLVVLYEQRFPLILRSGVGKSTQINAVANYVLGVQYSDEFRFRLIDEQFEEDKLLESQTRDVPYGIKTSIIIYFKITAYHFQWVEGFQCDTSVTYCCTHVHKPALFRIS